MATDRELLGLSVNDWRLINQAISAWRLAPNGNWLAAPRLQARAPGLIARGYLSKAKERIIPLGDPKGWLVVIITPKNYRKLVADLKAAREAERQSVLATLQACVEFLADEAENRSAAGSEMSDYEREPRELAERLRGVIELVDLR